MPPIRTITAQKPLKTERTHEENQERAYIAASRRSDRSLEARVESARRASEIHKRRTGRSLRVTEQDVINEEMYEEEDDDLPLQYRRLTAHLNTNSADFNRRMAAYLTNHVAMRNALDQAIQSSYAQQYPNGQPWSQGLQSPQSSWASNLSPTQQQQQQQFFSQLSPQLNRPSPYPLPGQSGYRASFSSAVPGNGGSPSQNSQQSPTENAPTDLQRRESAPAPSLGAAHTRNLASDNRPASTSTADQASIQPHINVPSSDVKMVSGGSTETGNPVEHPWFGRDWNPPQHSPNPLTTSLPTEAQMALYPHNLHPQPSGKGEKIQQPFYAYNPPQFTKSSRTHNMYDGIHQTLAPSVLDTNQTSNTWSTPTTASEDSVVTPFDNTFTFDGSFWQEPFTKASGNDSPYSAYGSGAVTPGENEWAAFINTSSWDDGTVQD